MDEQIVQEIVDEIFSFLEPLDTQSAALLQFLKAKGMAGDEELASYLEQAGKASNVRWLAARVRIKSLISSAMKTEEAEPAEHSADKKRNDKSNEPAAESSQETAEGQETGEAAEDSGKSDDKQQPEKPLPAAAKKGESKKESKPVQPAPDSEQDAA